VLTSKDDETVWELNLRKRGDGFSSLRNFYLNPSHLRTQVPLSDYYSRRDPTVNEGLIEDYNWIAIVLQRADEYYAYKEQEHEKTLQRLEDQMLEEPENREENY
jgi:hypothetical protein